MKDLVEGVLTGIFVGVVISLLVCLFLSLRSCQLEETRMQSLSQCLAMRDSQDGECQKWLGEKK